MSTREQAVAEARTWLKTPYHHNAALKGVGVDCAQILIEVYSAIGLLPRIDVGDYPKDWHLHRDEERYLGWIERYAHRVDAPRPGDIALFKFGRTVSHGGIMVNERTVLHAYYKTGVILTDLNDAELRGRLHGFWSLWSET